MSGSSASGSSTTRSAAVFSRPKQWMMLEMDGYIHAW